jgi:hypothetical protein
VREEGFELPKRMWSSREEEARVAARWYMDSFLLWGVSYHFSQFVLGLSEVKKKYSPHYLILMSLQLLQLYL